MGDRAEGSGFRDDLGNFPNSNAFQPRPDTLFDSTGNDLVQSGEGDDFINAFRGGDNRSEDRRANSYMKRIPDGVASGLGNRRRAARKLTHYGRFPGLTT